MSSNPTQAPTRRDRRTCRPTGRRAALAPLALSVLAALAGCGTLPPAVLALPTGLDQAAPTTVEGIGPGRSGRLRIGDLAARYERSASRLDLFERLQFDRAAVSFTIEGDGTRAACRLRGEMLARGVLQLPLRQAQFDCDLPRGGGASPARLEMTGTVHPGQRRGRLLVDDRAIEVHSVHRVAGSPLPLESPAGYVFTHQGRAVAALEVTTPRPRLWRAGGPALDDAITRAALALALLWDPAGT